VIIADSATEIIVCQNVFFKLVCRKQTSVYKLWPTFVPFTSTGVGNLLLTRTANNLVLWEIYDNNKVEAGGIRLRKDEESVVSLHEWRQMESAGGSSGAWASSEAAAVQCSAVCSALHAVFSDVFTLHNRGFSERTRLLPMVGVPSEN
jgi:hypothetical protein